jgi:hypothetical protein
MTAFIKTGRWDVCKALALVAEGSRKEYPWSVKY